MLYSKYRPEKFIDIIRPNPEVDLILNHLQKGNFGHATILSGSRGIGKTTTARLIAKALNCENFSKDVCGVCDACVSIKNGSFVDVYEIDGASNRKIDDARELRETLKFAPIKGKSKVYILDEVHMLTNEAFNALLKSIEEPPKYVYFLLCTTEPEKIPETIRSRCQSFSLKRPSNEQIIEKLKLISSKEGLDLSDEELYGVANYSNGGFRDAETLLTQMSLGSDSYKKFEDLYSYQSKIEYLEKTFENDYKSLLTFHKKLEKMGIDVVKWVESYVSFLRIVTHVVLGVDEDGKSISTGIKDQIIKITNGQSIGNILELTNKYIEIYSKIKYSPSPELLLDLLVLNSLNIQFETVKSAPRKVIITKAIEPVVKEKSKSIPALDNLQNNEPNVNSLDVEEDLKYSKEEIEEPVEEFRSNVQEIYEEGIVSVDEIKERWSEILKASSKENKPVETLLRVVRVVGIEENVVVFEVDFKFHSERLNSNKNKIYIENLLCSTFNNKLFFRCVILNKRSTNGFNEGQKVEEDLTDHNVSIPTDMSSGDILSIFDGAVPNN